MTGTKPRSKENVQLLRQKAQALAKVCAISGPKRELALVGISALGANLTQRKGHNPKRRAAAKAEAKAKASGGNHNPEVNLKEKVRLTHLPE